MNAPYLYVNSAEYAGNYCLSLAFNSGEKKLVDFSQFIFSAKHPDVQKYRNIEAFKQFIVADGDLFWNDYELFFPVDDLYNNHL